MKVLPSYQSIVMEYFVLDKVELRIFFKDSAVQFSSDGDSAIIPSLKDYIVKDGLTTRSQNTYDEDLGVISSYETHAYESLPSSYSGVAFNIRPRGCGSTIPFPHVMVKCSPAKILQGHNVYGHENLRLSVLEMISILVTSYPYISGDLDLSTAEISQIDVTYSSKASSPIHAEKILEAFSKISTGQIKSRSSYEGTVYFNRASKGDRSGTHVERVVYLKDKEVRKEIKEIEKITSSKKFLGFSDNDKKTYVRRLSALNSVYEYSKNLVRFEGRIKARKFRDIGINTNVWSMIKLSETDKTFFKKLWHLAFDKLFETFEGMTLEAYDHQSILQSFETLVTVDSKGRVDRKKSDAARGFYFELSSLGYELMFQRVREGTYPRRTWYNRINYLKEAGLSKAFITNISGTPNVIPLIREITVDFGSQVPHDYVEPRLIVGSNFDLDYLVDFDRRTKTTNNLRLVK